MFLYGGAVQPMDPHAEELVRNGIDLVDFRDDITVQQFSQGRLYRACGIQMVRFDEPGRHDFFRVFLLGDRVQQLLLPFRNI